MPNRSDMRTWIREQTLLEDSDVSDTIMNSWINQGLRELSSMFDWPWLAQEDTISTVSGTQSYDMPADMSRLEAIVDSDERRRLEQRSSSEMWERYGGDFPSGTPKEFFVWGSKLYLSPIPDDTVADEFTIYYYGEVTTLENDSDEPDFADRFHMALAEFGTAQAWKREEEMAKAEEAMGRFTQIVERMARFYLDRGNDQPMVFGGQSQGRFNARSFTPWIDEA